MRPSDSDPGVDEGTQIVEDAHTLDEPTSRSEPPPGTQRMFDPEQAAGGEKAPETLPVQTLPQGGVGGGRDDSDAAPASSGTAMLPPEAWQLQATLMSPGQALPDRARLERALAEQRTSAQRVADKMRLERPLPEQAERAEAPHTLIDEAPHTLPEPRVPPSAVPEPLRRGPIEPEPRTMRRPIRRRRAPYLVGALVCVVAGGIAAAFWPDEGSAPPPPVVPPLPSVTVPRAAGSTPVGDPDAPPPRPLLPLVEGAGTGDGSELAPYQGYLVIRSTIRANIFEGQVEKGPTNRKLVLQCRTYDVRLRDPYTQRWLTAERRVDVACQHTTTIVMLPEP